MRVDHLVWYSADLAEGERFFAERMDCRAKYGGVHPGEGTRNSLFSLSDTTYVEILGSDPAQPAASLDPELRALTSTGIYHWAVGSSDLADLRRKALNAGLDGSDIMAGGRTLPDGRWLGWKLFGIRNHGFGALVPFFIDWGESEHPAKSAPRGGSLARLNVSSPEPERLQEIYRILGLDVTVAAASTPGFSAIVESRKGPTALAMFDPVPRGYVI
ncbi:MAG: VOC family protein [Rhizobiales bacterium]|nr:VOC family protein [Hyphomicrobiales bacterium]